MQSAVSWRLATSISVTLAVLAAVATAAPAAATTRPPARPSAAARPSAGLAWHRLTLLHGWTSAQSSYETGNPSWAAKGGIVYLSGSVRQVSEAGGSFARLPSGARPAHIQYFAVYTVNYAYGQLVVDPDGLMYVITFPESEAEGYTSLAGISFPASGTAAHKLALRSGWRPAPAADDGGAPAYSLAGGVVHLSGEASQPSGTGLLLGVLPKGARPAEVVYLTVLTDELAPGTVRIATNGDVYAYGGNARNVTSLDGLSFRPGKTGWHTLTLLNGWASRQVQYHTGFPEYQVSGGVVYLSGAVGNPAASSDTFARLPKGARPAHYLYIDAYTVGGYVGTLYIEPDGDISVSGPNVADGQVLTSLTGISFPLGS